MIKVLITCKSVQLIDSAVVKPFFGYFQKDIVYFFICLVTYEEAAGNTKEEVEVKKEDKEVTFDCGVLGIPPANITWEKNYSPIDGKRITLETM